MRPISFLAALAVAAGLLAGGSVAVPAEAASHPAPEVPAPAPPAPDVTAPAAVLWDPADDRALFDRAAAVGRPMASTTKIMTVLLAIEAGAVGDTVTVSAGAAALGEATLDLQAGQQIPMESLVAGLLLRSGNDAALAVAEHVAGSEAEFVARMNTRARELGLSDTWFVNPSGLTNDPEHRASPLDLARLAEVAMGHPVFARYAAAPTAAVPGLGAMTSRNELLGVYPGATGVKTGYTLLAGLCLVASAERDGRTLYAVVLGSEDSFADATALLDWGFEAFARVEPVAPGAEVTRYRWADVDVPLLLDEPLARTVAAGARVDWRTVLDPIVDRPVERGARLGTAELRVDGEVVAASPLVTGAGAGARRASAPAGEVGGAVQEALRAFARLAELDRAV